MRNNSGHDVNSNGNLDPTLKERAGQGGPGERPGDLTEGESFEVAADRDQPGGERSPSARGRGETQGGDAAVGSQPE